MTPAERLTACLDALASSLYRAGIPGDAAARLRRDPRLAQRAPERLARVDVHVDPHEVEELARPHRPAGAVLHPGVEVLRRHAGLVEDPDAIVQERDQHPVDDESGRVLAA